MAQKSAGKQKVLVHNADQELDDALSNSIVVYTDGASKNNQDAKSRIAGYGIHWARGRPVDVECAIVYFMPCFEPLYGLRGDIAARCPGTGQTNNIGELLVRACPKVLECVLRHAGYHPYSRAYQQRTSASEDLLGLQVQHRM